VVGLLGSFRYDGEEINPSLAKLEAEILHEAIKNKKGKLDEVIRILTTRSKTQLKATFNRYRDDHGYSLSKVRNRLKCIFDLKYCYCAILVSYFSLNFFLPFMSLKKLLNEASDDFLKAVHVAIRCIDDHKKYYEKVTLTLLFLVL
jgi:annexin A13